MTFEIDIRRQLTGDEGRVKHVYKDSLGYDTIGIGRLVDRRLGGGLRDSEIDYLFDNDLHEKMTELSKALPWIHKLDDARRGVIVNMCFQMGLTKLLKFTNTLRMVQEGDYAGAAQGMLHSLWATQTPVRANRLSKQMRTGVWQFERGA